MKCTLERREVLEHKNSYMKITDILKLWNNNHDTVIDKQMTVHVEDQWEDIDCTATVCRIRNRGSPPPPPPPRSHLKQHHTITDHPQLS
jgi:hypothetical protein